MTPILIAAAAVFVAAVFVFSRLQWVTVYQFTHGVRFSRGRVNGVLEPGMYLIWPKATMIRIVEARPTFSLVPGQEILTSDGVTVKLSFVIQYKVTDPIKAVGSADDFRTALHTHAQLLLREAVAGKSAEDLLAARLDLGRQLGDAIRSRAAEMGLEIITADIRDIMFAGDLKKAFTEVLKAKQEGLAALERARGETAALRHLANAAQMIEQRPALMQLRMLQSMGEGRNTLVMGLGDQRVVPIDKSQG